MPTLNIKRTIIQLFGSWGLLFLTSVLVLSLTIRGLPGNPTPGQLNENKWKDNGPFELSPERGRFALIYSLVEDQSFHFSTPLAIFAVPDLGTINGNYVSLFAPAVSFLSAIGYILGKLFGASQVGSFAIVSLFGLLNALLIRSICIQFKTGKIAANLAGLMFLFATPAFAYAVSLYQHHISTFLILGGLYVTMRWKNILSFAIVAFLFGLSVPVDYPNLILMLPVMLYTINQFIRITNEGNEIKFALNIKNLLGGVSIVLPIIFFLWFNQASYSNPFQLASTVKSVRTIDEIENSQEFKTNIQDVSIENQIEEIKQKKSASGFFKTRNLLNGLYLHSISPDRGMLYFTPVVLVAFIGIFFLYRAGSPYLSIILGVIGFNILLYSMWGDPWGGWAFGSRYLVPSYSMLSILFGVTVFQFRKKILWLLLLCCFLFYSIAINTLGAITTNRNPPQVEILELEKLTNREEKFSYNRNWEFLNSPASKSFFYQIIGHEYLTTVEFYWVITSALCILSIILVLLARFN